MAKSKYIGFDSSSNPRLLGLNTWSNLSMLDLKPRQTHVDLGSTRGRTQVYWAWKLTRPTFTWALHVAKLKYVGSAVRQANIHLGSTRGQIQVGFDSLSDSCSLGLSSCYGFKIFHWVKNNESSPILYLFFLFFWQLTTTIPRLIDQFFDEYRKFNQ